MFPNKVGLQSSIFHVLGVAHTWNIRQLAFLYCFPVHVLENHLFDMGFSEDSIRELRDNVAFSTDRCYTCGIKIEQDATFCSQECCERESRRCEELVTITLTRKVPLTFTNKWHYDIESGTVKNNENRNK